MTIKPGMARIDFDSVAPLRPADQTAGRVTSGGESWEPKAQMPVGLEHWDSPPPMRPWHSNLGVPDLTGLKFGKLTVKGLWVETHARSGDSGEATRWVVRCACGSYEVRKPSAIFSGLERCQGHCWNCEQLRTIKYKYAKFGSRPVSDFTNGQSPGEAKPQREPHSIIASHVPSIGDRARIAKLIIADLQRNGYRIVREKSSS